MMSNVRREDERKDKTEEERKERRVRTLKFVMYIEKVEESERLERELRVKELEDELDALIAQMRKDYTHTVPGNNLVEKLVFCTDFLSKLSEYIYYKYGGKKEEHDVFTLLRMYSKFPDLAPHAMTVLGDVYVFRALCVKIDLGYDLVDALRRVIHFMVAVDERLFMGESGVREWVRHLEPYMFDDHIRAASVSSLVAILQHLASVARELLAKYELKRELERGQMPQGGEQT